MLGAQTMGDFYIKTRTIDRLKVLSLVRDEQIAELFSVIQDKDLERYFYEYNPAYKIQSPNPAWAKQLYEKGQFDDLNKPPEEIRYLQKIKSRYLLEIAGEHPLDVWNIIKGLTPAEQTIQANFLDAILKFPDGMLIDTVQTICCYLNMHDWFVWVWLGEPAAKVMERLVKVGIDEALEIAEILLEIKEVGSKDSVLKNEKTRFEQQDYEDFLFKFYKDVWEAEPLKSTILMLNTLDNFLRSTADYKPSGDNSCSLCLWVEDLNNYESQPSGIHDEPVTLLVKAICEALKSIAKRPNEEIAEILAIFDASREIIFKRFKLFLLAHTDNDRYKTEILDCLNNFGFFNDPIFKRDYDFLFEKKYHFVKNEPLKKKFFDWIEKLEVSTENLEHYKSWVRKTQNRTPTDEDVQKYVNGRKAQRIYRLREIFKEEYGRYLAASGLDEEAVRPRPLIEIGEGGWIDPAENSPKSVEELKNMTVAEVLSFLQNKENYSEDKSQSKIPWHTPREGLRGAFQQVVKEKSSEYLKADIDQLFKTPLDFLGTYFGGLRGCFFGSEPSLFEWERFFAIVQRAFEELHKEQINSDSYDVFLSIAGIIEKSWSDKSYAVELSHENVTTILKILEKLLDTPEIRESSTSVVQTSCNRITGEASGKLIEFALVLKNKGDKLGFDYESELLPEFSRLFDYILDKVQHPYAVCAFGMRMPQLYYTNPKWLEDNIGKLTEGTNWQNVWEVYLVWARPFEPLFDFLVKKGIYQSAINKLEKDTSGKLKDNDEKPEEHLGKHLVIAYFNGWSEKAKGILHSYYRKAPLTLKRRTNWFFTTGFENANEGHRQKIYEHWRYRLDCFKKLPKASETYEEAVGLCEWIRKCPLAPDVALGLLSKTLDYTNGTVGKDDVHYVPEFIIEGICRSAERHELLALECLLKFSHDPRLGLYSKTYENELLSFIKGIKGLPPEYTNLKEIKEKTLELLDDYGRMGIYITKGLYFDLLCTIQPPNKFGG
jgi:hypothetical protein